MKGSDSLASSVVLFRSIVIYSADPVIPPILLFPADPSIPLILLTPSPGNQKDDPFGY